MNDGELPVGSYVKSGNSYWGAVVATPNGERFIEVYLYESINTAQINLLASIPYLDWEQCSAEEFYKAFQNAQNTITNALPPELL